MSYKSAQSGNPEPENVDTYAGNVINSFNCIWKEFWDLLPEQVIPI